MLRSILSGYALVFFSTQWYVGFFFMLATFVIPAQGLAGLGSLVLSNLWARILGFSREEIRGGYYAYNGLLTGLALGLYYQLNGPFVLMLVIATFLGVLIAASIDSLFRRYLSIPVLSIPFVVTTWLVLAADQHFHGLIYTLEPFEVTFLRDALPPALDLFFRSLGATFFQLTAVAGILISVGLLLFSRIAFVLAVVGMISGTFVYTFLRGDLQDLHRSLLSFNFILTAITVGGIWTIPGPDSLILAAAGSALCALIAAASAYLFSPFGIPALAFPFVVTAGIIIFALKQRSAIFRFRPLLTPERTPEMNLKRQRNAKTRFLSQKMPAFLLPFSGEWSVTQGVGGRHTHKELWAHAWDFEVRDDASNPFREKGAMLEEFYSYNMPVYCPADGRIAAVVNRIEDNPVGQVNTEANWGNHVIVWHYGNVFTAFCHLRRGTVGVSEGEWVRQGQMIGRVGNSGRSITPHLHFHVQASPDIGAPCIEAELLHYVKSEGSGNLYVTHGIPREGERISTISAESHIFEGAGFPLGCKWTYETAFGPKAWKETWETEMDFAGNRFIVCKSRRARIRYTVNRYVLLLLDYEGGRDTGLYWLFLGLPRLPMSAEKISWQDELPGELMLGWLSRSLFDLLEPLYPLARIRTTSRFIQTGARFSVQTDLAHGGVLARRTGLGSVRITSRFEPRRGLVSLSSRVGSGEHFSLNQISHAVGDGLSEKVAVPSPISSVVGGST